MSPKKNSSAGNIKQLLSLAAKDKPKPNSSKPPQEVKMNGIIYRQVNTVSVMYKILSTQANHSKCALIDRGANGGIAGNDVKKMPELAEM